MSKKYTSEARRSLQRALEIAVECGHSHIGTEHLVAGMLKEGKGTAYEVLNAQGVSLSSFMDAMNQYITAEDESDVTYEPEYTPSVRKVLKDAEDIAAEKKLERIGSEHILMAVLMQNKSVAARLLTTLNINMHRVYLELLKAAGETEEEQKFHLEKLKEAEEHAQGSLTPTLDQYGRDLTQLAAAGKLDPVVGRDTEIARVIEILSRRKKNNPCLIGEPGVGKTAIVEGLAEAIVAGNVPDTVKNKRLVVLDMSGMVAGSKYRGEFEERIKKVIGEVTNDRNILLFIDELHTIIGAGGAEGALDASNILKPSLARGEIQLIGATTITEFRKYIEKDAALERRFQQVMVDEPGTEQTISILQELRPLYEQHHGVQITDEAIRAAVTLSNRYLNDRFQPDKALDLIDEASSSVQLGQIRQNKTDRMAADIPAKISALQTEMETAIRKGDFVRAGELRAEQKKWTEKLERRSVSGSRARKQKVTEEDIAATLATWTGIPVTRLAESETQKLAKLEQVLHERVIGQEEAVSAVSRAIRRGRVGLKEPNHPIGSFLFLGPTGVGKTELSKALAEAVFGSEDAMIRVDMSEYMEKASVSKLIGSPPGYVGYEEGGQLSEKIRRNPYSVLLFDEIEKAHPDVFNILLQVLDDGHITDSQGRKVSFKECIIIMTSNAGANRIVQPKSLGFLSAEDEKQDYARMKSQVMDEIRQMFRPEFLNRIDEILVFHALNDDNLKEIFDLLLGDLQKRCKAQLKIQLEITENAKTYLLTKGIDKKYGARPMKRMIRSRLEDPLAEELVKGAVKSGDNVRADLVDETIVFVAQ